jgi:hypothetical protein
MGSAGRPPVWANPIPSAIPTTGRVLTNQVGRSWFDPSAVLRAGRLTTNGIYEPLTLSLSKGERRLSQHPASVLSQRFGNRFSALSC